MNRSVNLINKMINNKLKLIVKHPDLFYFVKDDRVIQDFLIKNLKELASNDEEKLSNVYMEFIVQHIKEIDIDRLALILMNNYIQYVKSNPDLDEAEKKEECDKALKILKESMVNKNYKLSYMTYDEKTQLFEVDLISYDRLKRKVDGTKKENIFLKKIEERIPLERFLKNITLYNFNVFIKMDKNTDKALSDDCFRAILYNTIKEEEFENKNEILNLFEEGKIDEILKNEEICLKLSKTDTYKKEVLKMIRNFSEYIDFSNVIFFSAFLNTRLLELKDCTPEEIRDTREEMIAVRDILSQNVKGYKRLKIDCMETDTIDGDYKQHYIYSYEDLKKDLKRFIGGTYISDKKIEFFRTNILNGKLLLRDFPQEVLELLNFSSDELKDISKLSSENNVFLLSRMEKEEVVKSIFEQEEVSSDLLKHLIETKKIEGKDIIELFLEEKIHLSDIQEIKESINLEEEISNRKLYELYLRSQEENASEEEKKTFNRYVLLYKELKLKGKDDNEVKEIMDDFVTEIMENFEIDDEKKFLKDFYEKGIVSVEILKDWGEQSFIYELIRNNQLKRVDIKKIYSEKNDQEKAQFLRLLKEVLMKMDNTKKLNYIYILFDGYTEEDIKARNELEQCLCMDNYEASHKIKKTRKKKSSNPIHYKTTRNFTTLPYARQRLIKLLDKNYEVEFLDDGHVIRKLPNANNGEVLIEKLFDITPGKNISSYGAATYVLSEEDFVSNSIIIEKNGKKYVDRKKLVELAKAGKAKKIIHSLNWGSAIKQYFGVEKDGSRYTAKDIQEIDIAIENIEKSRQEL